MNLIRVVKGVARNRDIIVRAMCRTFFGVYHTKYSIRQGKLIDGIVVL